MIAQVLQRMNRREQVLAGLVALVVFFLANLFLWSWLLRAIGDLRVEVEKQKQQHNAQTCLVRKGDRSRQRNKWYAEHKTTIHEINHVWTLSDRLDRLV